MNILLNCYCQSGLPFSKCCQPYISGEKLAPTAESLMRSRFSAYIITDYDYILCTYAESKRSALSTQTLKQSAKNTKWLLLDVLQHQTKDKTATVEFKAYYQVDNQYYLMHELSSFEFIGNQWFYTSGTMLKDTGEFKQERNHPCLCGSGKKFKKCCGNSR